MPRRLAESATSAVVLTGAPGAGKSSVLEALATRLEIEEIAHGALETEELGRGWPWLPAEAWIPQLAAVLAAQRRAGRSLFLLAATIETGSELRALVDAIAADQTLVACLTAPPDTIAARLAEREPDRWPGKQDLIDRARRLAHWIPELDGIDLLVDTDGRDAELVASEIRDAMGSLPSS